MAALLGLVAYPGQGICKSIHKSVRSKTRKQVEKNKREEGAYLLSQNRDEGLEEKVVRLYDLLKNA